MTSTVISPITNESKTADYLIRRLILKDKLIAGDAAYGQLEVCGALPVLVAAAIKPDRVPP